MTILDTQEKVSEHTVMLIMTMSNDLKLRDFINHGFLLVFEDHGALTLLLKESQNHINLVSAPTVQM